MNVREASYRGGAGDRSESPGQQVPCASKTIDESAAYRGSLPVNAMSVDVEDYFQVSAFEEHVGRSKWDTMPNRISRNVDRILQLFDDADTKATFFILGWVAEKLPNVVSQISAEGHEIASHSFEHARVWTQTPDQFREDVSKTRKILEDVSGVPVIGYRAPSFSIVESALWAYDVLQESGYRYSSSIYPISHDHYGLPAAPRYPFRFREGGLLEIPLTTIAAAGRNWPCAGGGYFRLLPLAYSRWALTRVNNAENMPAVFYFHPWELDPGQPRVSGVPIKTRFRHYVNLAAFEKRLIRILGDFRWGRMDRIFTVDS